MGGWFHALLVQEGVSFGGVASPLVLTAPADNQGALQVLAHSATQNKTLADFDNSSTYTPRAAFTFRGNGEGSFNTHPAVFEINMQDTGFGFIMANAASPAGTFNAQLIGPLGDYFFELFVGGAGISDISMLHDGTIEFDTIAGISLAGAALSFFGVATTGQKTVTGSRGANAALASLLTALAAYGLIIDGTVV